jgi:hypothetical protein
VLFRSLGNKCCVVPHGCTDGTQETAGLCYTPCQSGYTNDGATVCYKNCNDGDVTVGVLCREGCRAGYHDVAGVCYEDTPPGVVDVGALLRENCRAGYRDVAGVCWQDCPGGTTDTGSFCNHPIGWDGCKYRTDRTCSRGPYGEVCIGGDCIGGATGGQVDTKDSYVPPTRARQSYVPPTRARSSYNRGVGTIPFKVYVKERAVPYGKK